MAEPFKFTPEQRSEIMRLAVMSAGPGASIAQITAEMERIAPLYTPASLADGALESIEWRLRDVAEWKKFTGTVLHVDREISSNRAIIILKTKVHPEFAPAGQEYFRTGITTDGGGAAALANYAGSLRGHKVMVNIGMEKMEGGNRKVRVVHDIRLLGADSEYDPNVGIDFASMKLSPQKLESASQWAV
ncbi:hypothetical protein ACXR2T_10195 [Leucobacter sp. HY1910]